MSRFDNRSRVSTYTQSWVGGEPDFGAFESIATTTLSTATPSVTFSNILATYKHLQLRILGRTDRATAGDAIRIQFNSDTTSANYRSHILYGNGTSAISADIGNTAGITSYAISAASAGANIFGVMVIDFLDYGNANKYKTVRSLSGFDMNGSGGECHFGSGVWMSSSAITSLTIIPNIGTNFIQYSSFALYGIKG